MATSPRQAKTALSSTTIQMVSQQIFLFFFVGFTGGSQHTAEQSCAGDDQNHIRPYMIHDTPGYTNSSLYKVHTKLSHSHTHCGFGCGRGNAEDGGGSGARGGACAGA